MIPRPPVNIRAKVKVTGSQNAKRRSSDQRELCTLSSAQPLVIISLLCSNSLVMPVGHQFGQFVLGHFLPSCILLNQFFPMC